jgi:hypothetical protein
MPAWALDSIRREPSCAVAVHLRRLALLAAAEPVQWMLNKQGVAAIARQRAAGQQAQWQTA